MDGPVATYDVCIPSMEMPRPPSMLIYYQGTAWDSLTDYGDMWRITTYQTDFYFAVFWHFHGNRRLLQSPSQSINQSIYFKQHGQQNRKEADTVNQRIEENAQHSKPIRQPGWWDQNPQRQNQNKMSAFGMQAKLCTTVCLARQLIYVQTWK